MSVPRYNRDKYYRIMDVTQSNYANQLTRLSKDAKRADFILIYYSLALIIYSLSVKFYPSLFDETWISYSSIILSIVVLIYSIINSKAAYPKRIRKIQKALNKIKGLKREVGDLPNLTDCHRSSESKNADPCDDCGHKQICSQLESLKKEYDDLVSSTEVREDIDFYHTICQLCKKYGLNPYTGKFKVTPQNINLEDPTINELLGYISENHPVKNGLYSAYTSFWHFFLWLIPILIFVVSVCIKLHIFTL